MWFFKIFVICLLFTAVSYGESFDQLIKKVLQESPYIQSLEKLKEEGKGAVKTAKLLPNPEANITFGRLYSQTDSGFALTDFYISQPLKLWGSRKFSIEKAKQYQQYLEYQVEALKNSYIGELYQLFFRALYKKESVLSAQKSLNIARKSFQFIRDSYKLGEESKINFLRARRELEKAELEYQKAVLEYKTALKELSAKAGFTVDKVEGSLDKLPALRSIDIEKLPYTASLQSEIKQIDKEIQLQKALAKPQISVEFVGGEDPVDLGKYEFGIGITSTIPVFNRNQGEILKLSAKKSSLHSRLNYEKRRLLSYIEKISEGIKLFSRQVKEIDRKVIPQLEEGIKLAEESLKLREITPFEFYNWKSEYIQTINYRLGLLNEIHQLYGEYIKIGGLK
ncbi:TolC family protein [Persephonella sp.]